MFTVAQGRACGQSDERYCQALWEESESLSNKSRSDNCTVESFPGSLVPDGSRACGRDTPNQAQGSQTRKLALTMRRREGLLGCLGTRRAVPLENLRLRRG